MKRIIIDYQKLTNEILDLLVAKYPDGYHNMDIISLYDKNKNRIDAIEVRGEDAIYLVKVSNRLANTMEEHNEEEAVEADDNFNDDYEYSDDRIFDETSDVEIADD